MSRPAEGGSLIRLPIPLRNAAGTTYTGVEASHRTDTPYNVIIVGQAGSGKSSLVNLIARTETADTSCDATGTTETNMYDILIQSESLKVKLFDTPGLDQDTESAVPDEKARLLLENLIRTLISERGGIQLIMYCVRGVRATRALPRNYEFIRSQVKNQVPIVLVATGLENHEPDMEEWWNVNERYISNLGMSFAGHACVTTATIDENAGSHLMERRNQSYHVVCNLIKQTTYISLTRNQPPVPRRSSTYTGVKEPSHRTDASCNVVIVGQAGAGKSSLVNLIAKTETAQTSCEATGCTTETKAYDILIQNESLKVKIFDTPGLDEGCEGAVPDEEARRLLKKLLRTLKEQGGIQLIMYCMRGERAATQALRGHYDFIRSRVKKPVPIVLVVTGLEYREPDMEEWWRVNERSISNLGMSFAGHVCVTTATFDENAGSHLMERRNQSYHTVCNLIKQMSTNRKNVVLFGQTGAGKSSLINLMAGKRVAGTSNDMKGCTMRSEEYDIEFGGESYKVFDTIGLEEPQLGLTQYLEAVENAYKLIQNLERRGGIDLLLFCMRAGRLTATLRNNYRLFHEFLCEKKVPIVVAITHLEEEEGVLDAWWERNEGIFLEQGVRVAGHACIIAADRHGKYPDLYEESRVTIRNLVKKFAGGPEWTGGNNLFVSLMRKLKELLVGPVNPRKDIVSRLTKRCGMSREAATQLADMIK